VASGTMLEDAVTGQVFSAQSLPDLFPPLGPPPSASPYSPVAGNPAPYSPVNPPQQPYSPVAGHNQTHPSNSLQPGQQVNSPYVRYDASQDFSRTNSIAQASLVLIILTFLSCVCMSWWSIGLGIGALVSSIQLKNAGHEKGPLYMTLSIIGLSLNAILFVLGLILNFGGFLDRL